MVETTIFKGYRNGQEVWAVHKIYGSGETATDFICEVQPTKEIISEYRNQKNVFDNQRKEKRLLHCTANSKKTGTKGL